MSSLNKLLVCINVIALACFNYVYAFVTVQPNKSAVLGASADAIEFETSADKYELEEENDYYVTEIHSSKLLAKSASGSFMLTQAYTAPDKDIFVYKVYIKKSNSESPLFELNLKDTENNNSKLYFYTPQSATGSFIIEQPKDKSCYDLNEIEILTVNITPERCIPENVTELIELGTMNINGKKTLINEIISEDLTELLKAAYSDKLQLNLNSVYRSHKSQTKIQAEIESQLGESRTNELVAIPGHSEHHLGTAIDFTSSEVGTESAPTFGDTRAFRWLVINAWKYGFVLSYPQGKSESTGYTYEPWHWRYVGKMHAEIYKEFKTLTLSEYLSLVSTSHKLY